MPYKKGSRKPYRLCWLEYKPLGEKEGNLCRECFRFIVFLENYSSLEACIEELGLFAENALALKPKISRKPPLRRKHILIGKIEYLKRKLKDVLEWENIINDEGFIIKRIGNAIVITGKTEASIVYATFRFINLIRLGKVPDGLYVIDNPKVRFRMINHWDNLDGSVERGYAGNSIFFREG